jgi:tetratricopeptide (TPR) repeat protein
MQMRRIFYQVALAIVVGFAATQTSEAQCAGPQALEAKLKAHADEASFAQLGSWFGEHEQYQCSIETLQAGLKIAPDSARLTYLLGLTYLTSDQPQEAVGPLQRSIQLDPAGLKPHLVLASTLERLNRMSEAKTQWDAAARIDPKSIVALEGLSTILLAEKDFPAVIRILHDAPLNENLAYELSTAYSRMHLPAAAVDCLKRALELYPASLQLGAAYTSALVEQGRAGDAEKAGADLVRTHPDDSEAERVYLRLLALNRHPEIGKPLGRKLLAKEPNDFELLYLNGVLESEAGDDAEAKEHLQEAIALNPVDASARYYLGLVYVRLDDAPRAKVQLQRSLALGSIQPETHCQLGTVLRNLGEMAAAKDQFSLCKQKKLDQSQQEITDSFTAQADEKLARGDLKGAIDLYRQAVASSPKDPTVAYKLALALDKSGDTEGERAMLEQAIRIDPNMALAENQLGYLASQEGDSASAEKHFRLAVKAAPYYTQAWISLAAVLGMQARMPEAREAIATALKLDPTNADAMQLSQALSNAQSPQ